MFLVLTLFSIVGGEIRDVDNHVDLFNAITKYNSYGATPGNNIIRDGAVIRVAQGEYTGSPFATSDRVYYLSDKYIDLICTGEPHSC